MFALCWRLRINCFVSNSLDLSAPEETYSRNVRVSGTLKFGYEGVFKIPVLFAFQNYKKFGPAGYEGVCKIITTGSISLLVACPRWHH